MKATLVVTTSLLLLLAVACSRPCASDTDCTDAEHCGAEGVCVALCSRAQDCALGELCARGRCEVSSAPLIRWLEPASGATVGERFDVEAEVRFRGPALVAHLERDPARPGEPCAPLPVHEVRVEGDPLRETVQRLRFGDVPSLGQDFALALRADSGVESRAVLPLKGQAREGFGGAVVLEPSERVIDADAALSHELLVELSPAAGLVSGWVEPLGAPPSPRTVLGQGVTEVRGARLPLARGPQILWLETERAGAVQRCGIGLTTPPPQHAGALEVALSYESDAPGDVQLWLAFEAADGAVDTCTISELSSPCVAARDGAPRLDRYGEEALHLEVAEGIYGIAVAPGAATGPVRATVRLSNQGVHLGWLGPRTVQTDLGEVWLAGRVYVLGGELRVEPLQAVRTGRPSEPPSAW